MVHQRQAGTTAGRRKVWKPAAGISLKRMLEKEERIG
jgi:hypothetical protein